MASLPKYLDKHALYPPLISESPEPNLGVIVVIPVYSEPDISRVLDSLHQCVKPACETEVLLIINHGENASEEVITRNRQTLIAARRWGNSCNTDLFKTHTILADNLPIKKAGVGLARKIGMDEAVRRFDAVNNPAGVIACLDADCTVSKNYLMALAKHFENGKNVACSLYFEHDLDACASPEHRLAIARYELHLRLYINGLKATGYPHAYHTVGSSMAVSAQAYAAHGGMNQRQAGEDFYFLSKYMLTGQMNELNETAVFPSPRLSDRVPFGTGVNTREWMEHPELAGTYPPMCYCSIQVLIDAVEDFWKAAPSDIVAILEQLEPASRNYLMSRQLSAAIAEIRANSASLPSFQKRFFRWLSPLRVMQMVRRQADDMPPMSVEDVAAALADNPCANDGAEQWLAAYRLEDRTA